MMLFQFANPLALVVFIGLLLSGTLWRKHIWAHPALLVSDASIFLQLDKTWRSRLFRLPDILLYGVIVLLMIALAKPQAGTFITQVEGQGIDIVLALDISGSMHTETFGAGTRLEAARGVLDEFIVNRTYDRIGLVVFAQEAYQVVPPTIDYELLRRFLSNVQSATEQGLADGTAIGSGLAAAGNMLRRSSAQSRVVIVLTDGANNAGEIGPLTAAEALAVLEMRVYTVGMIATVGVNGSIEQADEGDLQQIAEITGGNYFQAGNPEVLDEVYNQISALEQSDMVISEVVIWQDQDKLLIALAFGLLIIERILRSTYLRVLP
jgi:Ca-activated chloride channel family protein